MKILLVYPSTLASGNPVKYRQAFLPPLSLAILDRLTEQTNPTHDVKVINDCVESIDFNVDCDVVGITAITSQAMRAYQIADRFRARGKTVILGGVHPSLVPQEAIQHADSVVIGEAENTWPEVLSDIESGKLKEFYQDKGYPDLQDLVIPKWDNFNFSIYRHSYGRNMPRMPIFTTRGCVHGCKYCSVSKFFGRSFRYKPIENVIKEIQAVGTESFIFSDDNIICNADYTESLFKSITSSDLNIRWISQASVKILKKPHLIDLAAKAGCRSLIFGIESLSREALRSLKKGFNQPEEYVELYNRCFQAGIQPWFSMIFGLDQDSLEDMQNSIKYLIKNKMFNVLLWILTPLPGTDLYEEMLKENRIIDFDWSHYDISSVVFQPKHYSPESLYNHFWKNYKSLYSTPIILRRAKHVFLNIDKPVSSLINSLLNQIHSRKQISNKLHPYSMGIRK